VELAVAATLRALVAEHRADRVDALRAVVQQVVLDRGAHDAGGHLGPHGQRFAVERVGERVHLFFDDVGHFADAAREQARMLKHGRTHVAIAVAAQPAAHDFLELLPAGAGPWQQVIHAANGGDFLESLSHLDHAAPRAGKRASRPHPFF
jgi:hypothetical protein